jgi:hypothetical protein
MFDKRIQFSVKQSVMCHPQAIGFGIQVEMELHLERDSS